MLNVAEIICDKRDGKELAPDRIDSLITSYAKDEVPDYQMSAFAMAVYFQGMSLSETVALTRAMLNSGQQMHWSNTRIRVDKHSTGGIGDKVSIPLAPLLATAEVDVPMISGRGLGITGGTLDKLEAIHGFRCQLSMDEFRYVVNDCGCAIVSASDNLAIADKKLYALRDVTGTVPSIPLITASILSKKLAAGLSALVLDIKWGTGAFMKTLEQARDLANSLVNVAEKFGVKTTAMITDMNQPLGKKIGNAVEIEECLEILHGDGPPDLVELILSLGAEVLVSSTRESSFDSAFKRLRENLRDRLALKKFEQMIRFQDGMLNRKRPVAAAHSITADSSGFVNRINSERIGRAIVEMGGGRKKMGDRIDHTVGVELLVKLGDEVEKGQPIARVCCESRPLGLAMELVAASFGIAPTREEPPKLITETFRLE